jgi:RNA polymerase sigma-70 factor (ECF subfamily)
MQAQKCTAGGLVWIAGSGVNTLMEARQTSPHLTVIDGAGAQNPAHFRNLLLAVAKKQDKAAFAELFEYFAPRIKSFLMKGGAAPDQADELAQETMITVWQRASTYDPAKASASTWIFTIARNKRIDAIRKTPRPEVDADDIELADDAPSASDEIAQGQETDIMARAIQNLPQEQADLLYKSFFEDKTHADIAKETNLPLGTVKSRIRLALDRLRGDRNVTELR